MSIFEEVRQRVSYEELDTVMGWKFHQRGSRIWILSPFNSNDKNPSLCQYPGSGWKDFSTNRGGSDPTSLYAEVKGLKMLDAAKELGKLFNIAAEGNFDREAYIKERKPREDFRAWKERTFKRLCTLYHALQEEKEAGSLGAGLFFMLEITDYWTNILIHGSDEDALALFRELGAWGQ